MHPDFSSGCVKAVVSKSTELARRTSFVRDWFFFASFSGMSWKQTLEKYTHTVYTYLYGAYDAKDYI